MSETGNFIHERDAKTRQYGERIRVQTMTCHWLDSCDKVITQLEENSITTSNTKIIKGIWD